MGKLYLLALCTVFLLLLHPVYAATQVIMHYQSGQCIMKIDVCGVHNVEFTIDTGASECCLTVSTAQMLTPSEAKLVGQCIVGFADGRTTVLPVIEIHDIHIGEIEVDNVEAIVIPDNGTNLLGMNVLAQLEPWRLDTKLGLFIKE